MAFTLLLLSFLPACSDENGGNSPDIPDGKLYTLTIHLQPSANHTPTTKATTKAEETRKTTPTSANWQIGGCSSTAYIRTRGWTA